MGQDILIRLRKSHMHVGMLTSFYPRNLLPEEGHSQVLKIGYL